MSKISSTLDELLSKEQFFIELYKNIDIALVEDFERDVAMFNRLNIGIQYHKQTDNTHIRYYIEPCEKKYGTIGFKYKKGE